MFIYSFNITLPVIPRSVITITYTYHQIDYVNFWIKAVAIGIFQNSDVIDVAKDITSLLVSSIIIKTLLDVDLGSRPVFVLYHKFPLHNRYFRVGVK